MANYKIESVEGIASAIGDKLRAVGINDTDKLLQGCLKPNQRKELAEKTGISLKLILKFANMVDLYRINGIGSEYSELLEVSGVNTVPQLAQRNATNLTAKMIEVNTKKKLTRKVPTETEVTKWIEEAKTLPRMLQY